MKTRQEVGMKTQARLFWVGLFLMMLMLCGGCKRDAKPAPSPSELSSIKVVVTPGGPVTITSSTAEFQILPSGYVQAALLKNGQKLTLDDPEPGKPMDSNFVVTGGKPVSLVLDFGAAQLNEAIGKLGRGRRVNIPARALGAGAPALQAELVVEVYDAFPNIAFSTMQYKNGGPADIQLQQAIVQRHRFNSHDVKAAPYDMWSFQGASREWGEDET